VDGETLGAWIHTLHGTVTDESAGASVQVCVPDGDCVTIAGQPAQTADVLRWAAHISAPGTATPDRLQQTIEVYGIDAVGNRSLDPVTVSYQLDTMHPNLEVTTVVEDVDENTSEPILAGSASDGSAFKVYVLVRTPAGVIQRFNARVDDGSWSFTHVFGLPGAHQLWVQAVDVAGNIRTNGKYQIQFEVDDVFWYLYFPYVLN
jgi:hypothetical protein